MADTGFVPVRRAAFSLGVLDFELARTLKTP